MRDEVVGEQLVAEVQRRAVLGPELHIAFVGADQQTQPLLAQIVLAVAVGDRGQAAAQARDLGDRLGDEILVLGGDQRQVEAGHRRHLAPHRPAALITHGVLISPLSVRTIQLPSGWASVAVTGVNRWISAPRWRAPVA